MLIGIADFPKRDHALVNSQLERLGVQVLFGDYEEVKRVMGEKDGQKIYAWDYPTLLEEGLGKYVDKVLHVGHCNSMLSFEERRLKEEIFALEHYHYILSPCYGPENEKLLQRYERNRSFEAGVIKMVRQWEREIKDPDSLIDEQMVRVAENMIAASRMKIHVRAYGSQEGAVAGYLYSRKELFLNLFMMKEHRVTIEQFQAIIAHELGHASDPELPRNNEERKKWLQIIESGVVTQEEFDDAFSRYVEIDWEMEQKASLYGRQFLPKGMPIAIYEENEKRNEEGYAMLYAEKKAYFQSLLERKMDSPA